MSVPTRRDTLLVMYQIPIVEKQAHRNKTRWMVFYVRCPQHLYTFITPKNVKLVKSVYTKPPWANSFSDRILQWAYLGKLLSRHSLFTRMLAFLHLHRRMISQHDNIYLTSSCFIESDRKCQVRIHALDMGDNKTTFPRKYTHSCVSFVLVIPSLSECIWPMPVLLPVRYAWRTWVKLKIDEYQTTTKHDKARAVSTIPICCIIQEQTVTHGELHISSLKVYVLLSSNSSNSFQCIVLSHTY